MPAIQKGKQALLKKNDDDGELIHLEEMNREIED
jgi:hypothetical protein